MILNCCLNPVAQLYDGEQYGAHGHPSCGRCGSYCGLDSLSYSPYYLHRSVAELLTGASKAVVPHGFGHLHIALTAPLEGSLNHRSIRAHRFLGDIMRLHPLG